MVHIKKRNLLKILIKTVYLKKRGGGTVYLSFLSSQHMKKWEYMLIGKNLSSGDSFSGLLPMV